MAGLSIRALLLPIVNPQMYTSPCLLLRCPAPHRFLPALPPAGPQRLVLLRV